MNLCNTPPCNTDIEHLLHIVVYKDVYLHIYIHPGNYSVEHFLHLHWGECKQLQHDGDNNNIAIFILEFGHQVNTTHQY